MTGKGWHPHPPPGPVVRVYGSPRHPVRVVFTDEARALLVAAGWPGECENPLTWAAKELDRLRSLEDGR